MGWINQIFSCKAARNGNVVRRKVSSVNTYASMAMLEAEVRRRGFHMFETGDQVFILCNAGFMRTIC